LEGELTQSSHTAAVSADGTYTYQVYVRPYPGWWRRWHGRVITRDADGRNRFWPWRYGRDRDALVRSLWDEVHRDIEWRRGDAAVELLEVSSTLA
jgi:hypothetical protein